MIWDLLHITEGYMTRRTTGWGLWQKQAKKYNGYSYFIPSSKGAGEVDDLHILLLGLREQTTDITPILAAVKGLWQLPSWKNLNEGKN